MDKASVSDTGDCRFKSCQDRTHDFSISNGDKRCLLFCSMPVYYYKELKHNWSCTVKCKVTFLVRRHFVPRTNCPTALCTLPGDILSHFLNMNPHTLGKACAYLRHILDISWAIFGHICGIYVRKPLFNWHF